MHKWAMIIYANTQYEFIMELVHFEFSSIMHHVIDNDIEMWYIAGMHGHQCTKTQL